MLRRYGLLFCLTLLLSLACKNPGSPGLRSGAPGQPTDLERTPTPFEIVLSDGQPVDAAAVKNKTVEGKPLADDEVTKLLKMFKEPLPQPKDRPDFLKRPGSLPPPRAATPKEMPFPPKGAGSPPPTVKVEQLEVLSLAPEGAVDHSARVSISFNSPMIAVSDPSNFEGGDPLGITLEPRPEGKWRWLGTQTIIFEPAQGQMPRATDYKVTVPKGVKDVSGSTLAESVTQAFSLPRPAVVSASPSASGLALEPLITVTFNQAVDPQTTPAKVHLMNGGQQVLLNSLSLVSAEKVEPGLKARYQDVPENTVFFFQAQAPLKPGNSYSIEVEEGVTSLEGPLTGDQRWSQSFSTYDPLKMTSYHPEKGRKASPFEDFYLYFNNSLDAKVFSQDWVTVDPPMEDQRFRVSGGSLWISGRKKGNTKYKVTVSGKLQDQFQQTLGQPLSVTLATGAAEPNLEHGFGLFTVLDPNAKALLPVFTTNVKKLELVIQRVTPQDWATYLSYLSEVQEYRYDNTRTKPTPPGTRLESKTISISGEADTLLTTHLDLSEYLDDGLGNLVVMVSDPDEKEQLYPQREFTTWVQGTQVGLDLEVSNDTMVCLVTRLKDGKPLAGAQVTLGSSQGKTNESGTATVTLPATSANYCLVDSEAGSCFLPQTTDSYYGGSWYHSSLSPNPQWYFFDDRGLYKPGETAHIKGYVRSWQRGPKGQLITPGQAGEELSWTLYDPVSNKIAEGKTQVNAAGAVEIEVKFPGTTNLGDHQLRIEGGSVPAGYHSLNVQEFRRPEFEVTASSLSEQPHLLEDSATVQAKAAYYSGGGLAGSEVNWSVSAVSSNYTPPGRGEYTFGRWTPWWDLGPWWSTPSDHQSVSLSHQGVADGQGAHLLKLDFVKMFPPTPTSVTVTASVADVNRQQRSGSTTLLVHPSQRYVGLKAEKSFVDEKSDFEVEALVTDIDGRTLPGVPITVTLIHLDYDDNYRQVEKAISVEQATSLETSLKLKLSAKTGGSYKIRAEVVDEAGRLNRTEYNVWKAGGKLPSTDKVDLESLTLVPSAKEYKPGDTARILVMAPFAEGEGMVVWSRDGIERHESFTLKNGTATVEHEITEELIPNLNATLTVVGEGKWGDATRPAVATASLDLSISKASRELTIELLPSRQELEPGAEVEVEVKVKDHKGQPVTGAEVTLWVADEAVLGLVGYTTPSPMDSFYGHRPSNLSAYHLRTSVRLGKPKVTQHRTEPDFAMADGMEGNEELAAGGSLGRAMPSSAPAPEPSLEKQSLRREAKKADFRARGGESKDRQSAPPQSFSVRSNFDALAVFKGHLGTDKDGHTTVQVKLPDNLTRYRVMAVAVEGSERFGSSDQLLTARLPLMVRPSLPRFLNFGDKASLPVVIQNQTNKAVTVKVIGQANGVKWLGSAGREVEVPAKDRVEVRFQAEADQVGQAHFRFGVVAGENSDAATLSLPVYTPASGEAFATYGSIAGNEAINQPVLRPKDVWPQFGGLEISLSSTAMSELTDAFLYLYHYRFECAEQRASRMLGIAAIGEVLAAFNPQMMPTKADIDARMEADSLHLTRLQNDDGGWQYWRRDNDSDPFVSVHVAHALARSQKEKFAVNEQTMERSLDYLRNIEAHCQRKDYGPYYTQTLTAYALYVRELVGDQDPAKAKTLFTSFAKEKDPNLEAIGWLWPTLSKYAKDSSELKELRRLVKNRATQTADKAQFTTSYGESDQAYLILYSSRRTDALLLDGLLTDEPQNQLNTKLVRGLLSGRVKGCWNNTQENIWVLLALQSYFRIYEKETPDFLGQLWLGETFLGQESFKGRSAKEGQLRVPMAKVPETQTPLVVAKNGAGRLYYRVGMTYAPKSLRLPQESRGFTVERTFKGLDNEGDVRQTEEGDWVIKAGAKVEVTLTMVAPERRTHVALVDQLAAGLEPLNPALVGTPPVSTGGSVKDGGRGYYGWWWRWYQHENLRDERVEAFSQLVYPGVYTYTYTALATTPGEYVLPPAKAEEMYSPEVFGRTATGRLTVE
jgi:alpha-2-macroglobulin